MALLLGIARQLALAIANARLHAQLMEQELMHRDLELAGKLQQRFLPKRLPEIPGYSFSVEYSPALEVGGDFYAFLELSGGAIGIAVGDVSGKGVSAALCMARLTSELRYHAVGESEPAVILARVNRSFCYELEEGMFVTVALLALDPATGELKVARAGHPAPIVRDGARAITELGSSGNSPIGVWAEASFDQESCVLDKGDLVILYTDGITEALDPKNTLYGEARFFEVLRRAPEGPQAALEAVIADVDGFVAGRPPNDDLTLVCFGRA
jgi:sigma-B regulation protein RsbU (phosphoserine phosphatase)